MDRISLSTLADSMLNKAQYELQDLQKAVMDVLHERIIPRLTTEEASLDATVRLCQPSVLGQFMKALLEHARTLHPSNVAAVAAVADLPSVPTSRIVDSPSSVEDVPPKASKRSRNRL